MASRVMTGGVMVGQSQMGQMQMQVPFVSPHSGSTHSLFFVHSISYTVQSPGLRLTRKQTFIV